MRSCWEERPEKRPSFSKLRHKIDELLENTASDNTYLKLDSQKDYYCFTARDDECDINVQ